MSGRKPWMPWYITRWRNSPSVLAMSLGEQGAYRNLLDSCWENGGSLPNIPAIMWRYALANSAEEFEQVREKVMAMFRPSEDGQRLLNDTLSMAWAESELKMSEISQKRSEAGKRGAESRWGSDGKNGKTLANGRQTIAQDKTRQDKTAQDNKPTAAADAASASVVITLPLNDGTEHTVSEDVANEFQKLFPAADVPQQLREMRAWLLTNPTRRKTARGIGRFMSGWLSREQDRGGSPAHTQVLAPKLVTNVAADKELSRQLGAAQK